MKDFEDIKDQTVGDRVTSAILACALTVGWYFLAPDFANIMRTPLGKLTVGEIVYAVSWGLSLIGIGRAVISFVYQAVTGRDSVWFWHPD